MFHKLVFYYFFGLFTFVIPEDISDNTRFLQNYTNAYCSNPACSSCISGAYMTINKRSCEVCSSKFLLCNTCDAYNCYSCVMHAFLVNGICSCDYGYYGSYMSCTQQKTQPNFTWVSSLAALSIIAGGIGVLCRRRMRRLAAMRAEIQRRQMVQAEIERNYQTHLRQEKVSLKELEKIGIHSTGCIFGDSNAPFWSLNCGGYVCNHCSLNVVSAMFNPEGFVCPTCNEKAEHFTFINRLFGEQAEQEQSSEIKINSEIIRKNTMGDVNKCGICLLMQNERKIKCESKVDHFLCDYCYKRLIITEKIQNCPFCRTQINHNLHSS
jgi:hypothetical protein